MPSFRLDPREVIILMGFVGIAAYLVGFIIGMTN